FIAFILGLIMSHVIFNGGLRYMGSTLKYRNSTDHLIMSIGFVLGILSIIIFYNYLKITKTSLIELSIASKVVKANPPILSAISLIVCLISYLFNNYFFSDWNSREFVSLINIITSLVFMFSVSRVLLVLIKLMVERKKKTLFSIFSVKNFNDHKIMNPMINILLTSFILIILLVGTNDYMSYRTNELKEIVNIDFGITNIVNNIDSTYASLKDDEKVSHVDLGYYYTNVKVDELDTYFWFSISLDANQIQQYLNIDIETSLLEKLKNESIPYVILPIKFHYLNKLEVGDTVHININKQYENQPFVVGGFIDMGINEIMITNINYLDQYQDLNPNTILINTHDFNNIKKQDLIERYDQEMYYIIDYQEMIDNQIEKFTKLTQYISYIILVLVLSFMLTIFNNLALEFTKMEPTFSRLRVLGCSIKKLIITILLEKLVILFAIIVSVLSVLRVIMNNLSHFLIYYGTYEKIRFTFYSVIMAIMIGAFMYLVSVAFYLSKIRKIKIAEVLKNF
ncbi:MAG: hypothetical protein K0Q49_1665, partial [Haloplasmataceae bacterium]|nr:hypothetical protein [Haloplasmataceae bacterium]